MLESYFQRVEQLLPSKQNLSGVVGLDIGASSCKLVELRKNFNSYTLCNWGIEPIRNNDVKAAIQLLLKNTDLTPDSINTSLYGRGTLVRFIDLPRMVLKDLKTSIAFEADKYFPFAQDTIFTDCSILGDAQDAGKMSVLVAAAKKELVAERAELIESIGFQNNFIGINSIAVCNAFIERDASIIEPAKINKAVNDEALGGDKKNGANVILDIGFSATSLIILDGNIPRFTRDIFIGGLEITKRISNVLGISLEQAEQIKCNPADKAEELIKAYESIVQNLISEVRVSLDYFITEKNIQIQSIYVTGGGSYLFGLDVMLQRHLDVTFEPWMPMKNIEIASNLSPDLTQANAHRLVVALGLALSQFT